MSLHILTSLTPKPGPYRKGRRCTHTDSQGVRCITLLCTWNEGPECLAHGHAEQATHLEQAESFAELMAA